MAEITLKGFKFENGLVEGFSTSALEKDYIYFIRTSEDYKEGYVYFNGKEYGNSGELKKDLLALSGATVSISDEVKTLIGGDSGVSVRAIASAVTNDAIAKLIDGAPQTLDTLKEIADWIESTSGTAGTLIADVESLKKDNESLKEKDTEIEGKLNELSGVTSGIIENMSSIKADIQKNKNDIITISGATSGLVTDVAGLKDSDVQLGSRIDALEAVSGNMITSVTGDAYVSASAEGNKMTIATNAVIDLSDTGLTATGKVADAMAVKEYVDAKETAITEAYQAADNAISGVVNTVSGDVVTVSKKVDNLSEQIGQIIGSQVTYKAGDGIKVEADGESGATISAKIAEGTPENIVSGNGKNFLSVDAESGMSVKGVDADAAVVISDIVVAGLSGQLGSGEYKNGSIIKAGTSLQEILQNLFCKELWSQQPKVTTAFTVTVANPTVKLTKTGNVEVGTPIKIGEVSANPTTGHSQSYSVGTFDYGYAWDKSGSGATTAKTYTQRLNPTPAEDGQTNSLSQVFSGFKNETGGTIETVLGTDSIPSVTVYAAEGNNSVTVSQTGWTYNSESVEPKTMYIATNLGNYYQQDKIQDNTISVNPTFASAKTATSSAAASVKGFYGYFSGFTAASLDYSDLVTSRETAISEIGNPILMTTGTITIPSMFSSPEKPSHVIILPSTYKISSMKNSMNQEVEVEANYKKVNTFEYVNKPFRTNYDVYVLNSSDKIEYKDIVITKA